MFEWILAGEEALVAFLLPHLTLAAHAVHDLRVGGRKAVRLQFEDWAEAELWHGHVSLFRRIRRLEPERLELGDIVPPASAASKA